MYVCVSVCGGQRTTFRGWFSPSPVGSIDQSKTSEACMTNTFICSASNQPTNTNVLFLLYVYPCYVRVNVCAPLTCLVSVESEEDVVTLKLQMVVSCHVGAGNQTQVLCKSNNVLNC